MNPACRTVAFILLLSGFLSCSDEKIDCIHRFAYKGKIDVQDSVFSSAQLKICFQNLGDVISSVEKNYFRDTIKVNTDKSYMLKGEFTAACKPDRELISKTDETGYVILLKDSVISSGKFYLRDLDITFADTGYTILSIPEIKIEKAAR